MLTIVTRIGVLVLLVAALVGCGASASDLAVGDCFDAPVEVDAEVTDVVKHDCTEPHTGEVIAVQDVPGEDGSAYPTDAEWQDNVSSICIPAFDSFTGLDFETEADWDIGYLVPTTDGWDGGDREMSCYATRVDGAPTSTSLKAAS